MYTNIYIYLEPMVNIQLWNLFGAKENYSERVWKTCGGFLSGAVVEKASDCRVQGSEI